MSMARSLERGTWVSIFQICLARYIFGDPLGRVVGVSSDHADRLALNSRV